MHREEVRKVVGDGGTTLRAVVKVPAWCSRTQIKDRPSVKDILLLDFTPTPPRTSRALQTSYLTSLSQFSSIEWGNHVYYTGLLWRLDKIMEKSFKPSTMNSNYLYLKKMSFHFSEQTLILRTNIDQLPKVLIFFHQAVESHWKFQARN